MKNRKILAIIISIFAVCTALGVTAAAAYDSSEDPLITWSYLRDIFKPEILDIIDERFEEYDVFLSEPKEEETETETSIPEEDLAEQDEYQRRLDLCKQCQWLNQGICRKCGCFVEARAYRQKSVCPHEHPRW